MRGLVPRPGSRRCAGLLVRRPGRGAATHWPWLLLVGGGGPTAEPQFGNGTVVFGRPADADLISHAMKLRLAVCHVAYDALSLAAATTSGPTTGERTRRSVPGEEFRD